MREVILIGVNRAIDTEKSVVFVQTPADIAKTKAGALIVLNYNESDLEIYANLEVPFAVKINSVKEFIFLSATKAKYAIAELNLAIKTQKIAENYLTDLKVLAIAEANEIEVLADKNIDGIFANDLIKSFLK